jgi:two-component system CheB/CheR fusion protein
VGIGASAGGVEAFEELLQNLRKDTGMAFVLVLHLPAEHESRLSDILGRVAAVPVTQVVDRMPIEPNRAYVLPAGADLDIENGRLHLSVRTAGAGHQLSIDHFFASLAEHQAERAIGVLLSGSSADGTRGIQQIKAAGGITFAQDATALYTSMPRSAIATGAVDFVLPPREIAHELGRIASHPFLASKAKFDDTELLPDVEAVLQVLREHAGVDFTRYKRNTLARRIARRIVLQKVDGVTQYVRLLRANPQEVEALYQDVLINVTSFFRNPEAFEVLKAHVFPALVENRSRHDPVRIWTLGCSTGEEAYSLAMAFAEYTEALGRPIPLQVFATDLNVRSVEKARMGTYSRSGVQGVSPERLLRYFVEIDGHYRVAKSIRDVCVFARHNVLTDPPFSRVDLVSCRNMLIYLSAELQQKVMPVLHYALNDSGFLWLGTSETIGSYRELFDLVDTRYKVYAKKGDSRRRPLGAIALAAAPARVPGASGASNSAPPALDAYKDLDKILAARYAPPSVLVSAELEILQYRGDTSRYLAPAPGRASLNLLKMVRPELVLGVRSAMKAAVAHEAVSRQDDLRFMVDGVERRVNVEVIPVRSGVQRAAVFMVVFEEAQPSAPATPQNTTPSGAASDAAERLQQELAATREYLQSVIEQQEAANEELQSANEEVQSTNEELQSINEELETSKEEVQSSNEELATVNDELHSRNVELALSNNDLVNLLASVQLAIVMLGPDLRIRRFTPMAEKLLNLIPTDVGRRVSDIKGNFEIPNLESMVEEVIQSMTVQEREVRDRDGHWYLMRIRAYRTLENKIDGAVVVFVDVDSLKRSQEALRQQTELLNQAHEPIIMWELEGDIIYWNKAAEETYGFTREQAIGRKAHELLMTLPSIDTFAGPLHDEGHWTGELVHTRRDAQKMIVESRMVLVGDSGGRKLVVEANRPITERKESERVLRRLADDLVTADRHKDEFLAMLGHELRNPLAPLRNVVAVLKSDGASEGEKGKALDIMQRQVSNMARLIDDLLDVSRITLSQIELRRQRIEVVEATRRVAEQNAAYFEAREQRLRLNLPRGRVYVNADAVRFEQIVGNLLHNASKYTQHGGEVSLTVGEDAAPASPRAERGKGEHREVVICVKDSGIGIAPEKLPHVFDMFMRATRSVDQESGGLGLGLTLVARLVQLHGGTVEARSEGLGTGSEFVVRLPTAEEAAEAVPVPEPPAARPAPLRVLVVDDNTDAAESLAMLLRTEGHEVAVATNGERALEIAPRVEADLMLVDIAMSGMNGYELARALRTSGLKDGAMLVAMSGFGQAEAKAKASEAGFDAYLVKPASLEDLNRVLVQRGGGDARAGAGK